MRAWTALAEQIAADVREPGFGAAASVAAAWAARADPAATRSLVRAAVVLAGSDVIPALWERLPPCPDAATLLEWGENLESHLADLLKRCTDLGMAARGEQDDATTVRRDAATAARRAEGAAASASPAASAAAEAARDREQDAARVVADCEAALDLLGQVDGALRCALDCVRALPADLDEAYEAAARIVAEGGTLPHSGDFIAPGPLSQATTQNA